MSTRSAPILIDKRLLKIISQPTRAQIMNILSEGPSSPSRMHRRIDGVSLNLLCHHIKVLNNAGAIELIDIKEHGGRKEHIYRATRRQFFDLEEWLAMDPDLHDPLSTPILQQISDDIGRAAAEGRINELPDRHLSRAPVEVDKEGWSEMVEALKTALYTVLEAHAKSAERAQKSGEPLTPARVIIIQFPFGRGDSPDGEDVDPSLFDGDRTSPGTPQ